MTTSVSMNKLVIIEVIHCDIFVCRQMVVNNCQGNVCGFEEKDKKPYIQDLEKALANKR